MKSVQIIIQFGLYFILTACSQTQVRNSQTYLSGIIAMGATTPNPEQKAGGLPLPGQFALKDFEIRLSGILTAEDPLCLRADRQYVMTLRVMSPPDTGVIGQIISQKRIQPFQKYDWTVGPLKPGFFRVDLSLNDETKVAEKVFEMTTKQDQFEVNWNIPCLR